jgi:hypothetical protein
MSDSERPEKHTLGKRIFRDATPAERERHAAIRAAVEAERPEIVAWAREESARAGGQVAVGTTFTSDEIPVLDAIDAYAVSHNLPGRSAVVRAALSRLLDIEVDVEPKRSA